MKWFETDSLVYRYTHYRLLQHDINIIKSLWGREGSASIPIQKIPYDSTLLLLAMTIFYFLDCFTPTC